MSSNNINNQNFDFLAKEEEIDLLSLKFFIFRRKKIISIFAGFGFIYGFILGIISPKVWEGRFQIVLEDKGQNNSIIGQAQIPGFLSNQLNNSDLMTEVEILSSPSVLFEIFSFVETKKNESSNDSNLNLRFDNWFQNLDIKLKKGTSVLNISYRDTDKELILPVLEKISITYQDYAISKRTKDIESGLNNLNNEIEIYKKKSFDSFIKTTNYAKENKLDSLYLNPDLIEMKESNIPNLASFNLFNIEQFRIKDASRLENINLKLDYIEKYNNDPNKKFNLIRKIVKDIDHLKVEKLDELESLIIFNLSIFKENDPKIQQLLIQKEILLKEIERNVVSYLLSEKELIEAKIKVSSRPQEVIDKYKQLLSQASRDQITLEKLENERDLVSIEKSMKNRPWQLITKPTILDQPVSSSRKKILLFEILKFSIIGIFTGFLLDKKDGLIYNKRKIEELFDCNLIQELSIQSQENWSDLLEVSSEKLNNLDSLSIIPLGDIDNIYIDEFSKNLSNFYKNEVKVTKNLIESVKKKAQLIIVSPGAVKKDQIIELNKFFSLTKSNLIGFFLLIK